MQTPALGGVGITEDASKAAAEPPGMTLQPYNEFGSGLTGEPLGGSAKTKQAWQ